MLKHLTLFFVILGSGSGFSFTTRCPSSTTRCGRVDLTRFSDEFYNLANEHDYKQFFGALGITEEVRAEQRLLEACTINQNNLVSLMSGGVSCQTVEKDRSNRHAIGKFCVFQASGSCDHGGKKFQFVNLQGGCIVPNGNTDCGDLATCIAQQGVYAEGARFSFSKPVSGSPRAGPPVQSGVR
jgi:hypothetical protein